ncbi:MAG: sigma-70 family RNA polymerase sigma factor [Bacteroidota bacterium]
MRNLNTLANAWKTGDHSELEKIFRKYQQYCINKLTIEKKCLKEEAEDIYTEAILNLRSKVIDGRLTSLGSVKYYLSQTCVNMFYLRIKQKMRQDREVPDVERFFYESEYVIDEIDYDFEEAMEITNKVWPMMKEKCKDIIHYFYIDKLKMDEIAELMGFSNANVAKTIKSRCYKKMLSLAEGLKESIKTKNDA